ncbi:hypothetical protein ACP275_13G127700 [Erythranthe tilingii]
MEPDLDTTADNSEEAPQEIIDDGLERVFRDFSEFKERILQSSSSSTMKNEDLIDLYINNGRPQTTLLEEVNEFESVLPPQQVGPTDTNTRSGCSLRNNIEIEIQDSETIIREMAESGVTYIRYGDLNNSEAANALLGSVFGGGNENAFGSAMRFLRRMYLCSNGGVNGESSRQRVKRKYRN